MANQISSQQKELVNGITQALQEGVPPQQILELLVKIGIPEEQAVSVLQQIMQQTQQGSQGQMSEQPQQMQPAMRRGGIPRAAMGMQAAPQFGTGMIQTMPNVRSFPSYNAYKTAYDQYLNQLGTARETTFPNIPDIGDLMNEGTGDVLDVIDSAEYYNAIKDNPELATALEKPVGSNDSAKSIIIQNAIDGLEPLDSIKKKIAILEGDDVKSEEGFPWYPVLGTVAGLGGAGLIYSGGKKGYKFLKRRYGNVSEVDLNNLSPREREAFMKTVEAVKARVIERGYYTKADVNDLVSNGMTRQDAEAFVADMLTKKQKRSADKKARSTGSSTSTASDNQVVDDDIAQQVTDDAASNVVTGDDVNMDVDLEEAKQIIENDNQYYQKELDDPKTSNFTKSEARKYFEDPIQFYKDRLAKAEGDPKSADYVEYYKQKIAQHELVRSKTTSTPTATDVSGQSNVVDFNINDLTIDDLKSNVNTLKQIMLNDLNSADAQTKLNALSYFEDPVAYLEEYVKLHPDDVTYKRALIKHRLASQLNLIDKTDVDLSKVQKTKLQLQAKKGNTAASAALAKLQASQKAGDKIVVTPKSSYNPKSSTPQTPKNKRKFERQKLSGRVVDIPPAILKILQQKGEIKLEPGVKIEEGELKIDYGKLPKIKGVLKHGGQWADTYSAGVYYGMGGYVPEYAASAYGVQDLPQFRMGSYYDDDTYPYIPSQEELAAAQMMYNNPFVSSPLAKFVYPQSYADGGATIGMSPEEQQMMMMQQQQDAAGQQMPQEAQGGQEEQIIQAVVQMLQQGAQPEQILQQLVQAGVPQQMAIQVIQMVMQQMQGAGGQEQMAPQQPPMPMQKYGGSKKRNSMVGREMDVTPQQMEELRRKGVKFEII